MHVPCSLGAIDITAISDGIMKKIIWTREKYDEEYKRYVVEKGDPPPTSLNSALAQGRKHGQAFQKRLREEGIFWETQVCREYEQLRDTKLVQDFLESGIETLTYSFKRLHC